jgi:ribonuclease BN (tRNA processing enzyme)
MNDTQQDEVSDLVYGLERINQIIDLCIDRELYKYLKKILCIGRKGSQYLKKLPDTALEEFDFSKIQFPILKIIIPSDTETTNFFQFPALFKSEIPPFDLNKKGKGFPLLKHWSDLFWAKRVRAELQKHNRGRWLERYEDITLFLESRMPTCIPPRLPNVDFLITKFNYLMELSAVTQGEASFGYAERARESLNKLYQDYENPTRGPYNIWILWNKGTAYQHIGRNEKAVRQFNGVIKEFWRQEPEREDIQTLLVEGGVNKDNCHFDILLEYLVNIVPAYLQRAAINLKLQLGYHALQTLSGLDEDLDKISSNYPQGLIYEAIDHLKSRITLHRIDALLQLESLEEAEKNISRLYQKHFNKSWSSEKIALPHVEDNDQASQNAVETQLIEHIIKLMHQKSARITSNLRDFINNIKENKNGVTDNSKSTYLSCYGQLNNLINIFPEYWNWVKGNNEDGRIHYSRWAQLLKLGMEAVEEHRLGMEAVEEHSKLKNKLSSAPVHLHILENNLIELLKNTIGLYSLHSEKLPVVSKKHDPNMIELEKFRSDDLPDFTSGLSVFYEKISDILLRATKKDLPQKLKEHAEENLKIISKAGVEPDIFLENHHKDLRGALDQYERDFGENQKIKWIKRYNEKEIWRQNSKIECTKCCQKQDIDAPEKPYYFDGLLACHEEPPKRKNDLIYCDDYEYIMQKSEDLFIKHLHARTLHKPTQKALHFIGLQRWNSLTPAQGRSVGGGYLIYRTDEKGEVDLGIAIDPGFDFVRNLFLMGFSLRDIDIVVISHAHADHLWDFETMVQLLHELEGKEKITHQKITHRLNVIMTLGIYKRLSHIIKNPKLRRFINPLVVDIRKEIDLDYFENVGKLDKNSFKFKKNETNQLNTRWQPILPIPGNADKAEIVIKPTRAYHEDYTDISDSYGFIIDIKSNSSDGKNDLSFGYTGDTKWVDEDLYFKESDVASQYKDCNVLLFHIGSLIDHKKGKKFINYNNEKDRKNRADNCIKLIRKENHPYLMGTIRFLKKLGYPEITSTCKGNHKLILLGEFGEELRGGIRTDLVKRFQGDAPSHWPIVPVDVGFDVLLYEYSTSTKKDSKGGFKFLCALCDEHRPIEVIDYFRFGQDEAIFHICKTCKKATPDDVRQLKLRKLYEIGRDLRTLPDKYNEKI